MEASGFRRYNIFQKSVAMDSDPPPDFSSDRITLGSQVEIELIGGDGERERLTVTLVPDAQADFATGFLGESTPLARALFGQLAGAEVPYQVADMRAVKILAVSAEGQKPTEDIAARREAAMREAVAKSEFIQAMMFATAVDTKWGGYDPDSLDPEKWGK